MPKSISKYQFYPLKVAEKGYPHGLRHPQEQQKQAKEAKQGKYLYMNVPNTPSWERRKVFFKCGAKKR
jgi:hypothetical protein